MDRLLRARQWLDGQRDLALEILRIFLGFALFLRGVSSIRQGPALLETVQATHVFGAFIVAHYVIIAHLAGGVLLCIGFLTRLAAAVQVPVLLGAVFLVHRKEGLFTVAQTLEFSLLVLFLLVLFSLAGGGALSCDYHLAKKTRGHLTPPVHLSRWRDANAEHDPMGRPRSA